MRPKGAVLDQRVQAVTEAAARLFSTRGFLETSMDDIARAAGLSKGGMYHYFKSKTEILLAIVSEFMDAVLGDVEGQLAPAGSAEDRLAFLVRRHVETYAAHTHAARVLLNEAYNLPSKELKKVNEKERRYYAVVSGVVADLLGPGADKAEVTAATFSLLGMCNWIYSWYDPKGPMDPDRLSRMITGIFTGGVGSIELKRGKGKKG